MKHNRISEVALTVTEVGMLAYWVLAALLVLKIVTIDPAWMYSDYANPLIVAWNWSFFPIDVLFAILGLTARFSSIQPQKKALISVISLTLMFCAGLMALSFWSIRGTFDPLWWGVNLWLMFLSAALLLNFLFSKSATTAVLGSHFK